MFILSVQGCRSADKSATVKAPDRDALLRVGFTEGAPALCLKNKDGEPYGLEVELIRSFCRKNKYIPDISFYSGNELFFALRRGEIDIAVPSVSDAVISANFLTPCAPHLQTGQRILVNKSVSMYIKDKEQIDNDAVTVLTVAGSSSAYFAKEILPSAKLISLKDIPSCTARVRKYDGNVFMIGAYDLWKVSTGKQLKTVLKPLTAEEICWAVRRDDRAWGEYLDAFIDSLRKDGTLDSLIEKYSADRMNR